MRPLLSSTSWDHRAGHIPSIPNDMNNPGLREDLEYVGQTEDVSGTLLNQDLSRLSLAIEPPTNIGCYRWRRCSRRQTVGPIRAFTSLLPDFVCLEDVVHVGVSSNGLPQDACSRSGRNR